jgi:hypothetical protein
MTGCDISAGGLGLVLGRAVSPGSLMDVELRNPRRSAKCSRLMLVVHSRPDGSGGWMVGGTFYAELTEEELMALRT